MKLGKASGTLSLAILAALASNAAAAEEDRGFYVGGNYGWTAATIDDERIISSLASRGITVTDIEDFDRDNGFKVYAGYQFTQHFALEGGYVDLGEFGYLAQTLPPGTLAGHIELDGWNLDLVGSWPITDRFAVFGRIGAIHADAQTTFVGTGAINVLDPEFEKSATHLKYGVGLEFDVTRALSLRLEAERYRIDDAVGNIGDIDMLSAGLVLRFGRGDPIIVAPLPTPGPDCSALDDDRDGVNNCNDRCPGSAAGFAIGPDGCPVPAPEPEPYLEPKPFRG